MPASNQEPKRCHDCGEQLDADDITWPSSSSDPDSQLCQNCWEADCDREWWRLMGAKVREK